MKAMTILTRCRNAEGDKRRIKQQIQRRRDAISCITPRMDAIGGGRSTAEPDKIGAFVVAVEDLENRLKLREQRQNVEVAAACLLLDMLPEIESEVLHEFYINCAKVPNIARHIGYSESYVRRVKADAERLMNAIPEAEIMELLPPLYGQE